MVKEVTRSPSFLKQLNKMDKSFLDKLQKLLIKIMADPEIGKPMRFNRKGTKELYLKPFRISYAYDKNSDHLYLLDIYHKDEQ